MLNVIIGVPGPRGAPGPQGSPGYCEYCNYAAAQPYPIYAYRIQGNTKGP